MNRSYYLGFQGHYRRVATPRRMLGPRERHKAGNPDRARQINRHFLTPIGSNALATIIVQQSFVVGAGSYRESCELNLRPSHNENFALRRDVRLFPLTVGFLKLFASLELTQMIFNGGEDSPAANQRKADNQMVGWISVFDALNTVAVINDVIRGAGMKLRFPTEMAMTAFLSEREGYGVEHKLALFHTSNHFLPVAVPEGEKERMTPVGVGLRTTKINDHPFSTDDARILNDHVFVYRCSAWEGKVSRYAQRPDSKMNTGIFYEVVTI